MKQHSFGNKMPVPFVVGTALPHVGRIFFYVGARKSYVGRPSGLSRKEKPLSPLKTENSRRCVFRFEKTSAFLLCLLFIYIIGGKRCFLCTHFCISSALMPVTGCARATSLMYSLMYLPMYFWFFRHMWFRLVTFQRLKRNDSEVYMPGNRQTENC